MITTTSIAIALAKKNVEWSNNYDNVILFNNDNQILSYLNLTDTDFINYNFPLFSSTRPRDVVIDLSNENKNVYDIVNSNYLVARLITSDGITKYYYYFVNSATQSTQTTFVLSLTLDVFTTYKLNVDFSIKNVLTARKHCNRFKKMTASATPMWAWRYDDDSEVMIEDDIEQTEYPKYLRSSIKPVASYNPNVPKMWLYLYVSLPTGITTDRDKTDGQVLLGYRGSATEYNVHVNYKYEFDTREVVNNFAVLIAPLKTIIVDNVPFKPGNATVETNWIGFSSFNWNASNLIKWFGTGLNSNNGRYIGQFKVYGANVGEMPPLNLNIGSDGHIDYDDLQETNLNNNQVAFTYVELETSTMTSDNTFAPFLVYSNIKSNSELVSKINFDIPNKNGNPITGKFIFNPRLVGTRADKQISYEPKLYKSSFRSLRLKSNISEVYKDFPILNILGLSSSSNTTPQLYFAELPAIDGINYFTSILDSANASNYIKYNNSDFIGAIYKNNFSFAITSDAYTEYLLNNKNAFMTGVVLPTAQSIIQTGSNLLSARNSREAISTLNNGILGTIENVANFHLKMDNLRNTPDTLKYIQSNSIEALLVPSIDFAPYIEFWEAYEIYLQIAYDYFYAMGYKVNKFTSSSDWNNRKFFNYVQIGEQCESKIISEMPMSLEIKKIISNALLDGITFWNYTDDFIYLDYSMENWENDLL